jgi:hypothetical protein
MGAIDNVKEIAKLVRDLGNMELYRQILDLQGEITELTQTNRELQTKVRELEETLHQVGQMEFRTPFYYAKGDDTPHCPRCWEVDKKAVHYPPPFQSNAGPVYKCPNCKLDIVHPRRALNR